MANRDDKTVKNARDDQIVKNGPHFVLDITGEVCPLTFVRTKLLVERMALGDTADVLLRGAEPLANVPRALQSLGHQVLEVIPLVDKGGDDEGVHRMRFRKQGASEPARGRDS
jgi:TusA-related sulfurtransferase